MKTINLDLNESCRINLEDFIIYNNKRYKFVEDNTDMSCDNCDLKNKCCQDLVNICSEYFFSNFKLVEKPSIDNFELLSKFLPEKETENKFYHVQILKRKKENPDIGSNSILINSYFVKNQMQLNYLKEEIQFLCRHYNARAYINLNVRDKKQLVLPMIRKLISYLENNNFSTVHKIFDSVCGSYTKTKNKLWVIDLDNLSKKYIESNIIPYIESLLPKNINKCKTLVPTINGYHLITSSFDSRELLKLFPNITIHKNNPTLLYYDN